MQDAIDFMRNRSGLQGHFGNLHPRRDQHAHALGQLLQGTQGGPGPLLLGHLAGQQRHVDEQRAVGRARQRRPVQQLVGFARVTLEPGATGGVTFEVHPSRLAFYDEAMRFVTEPGAFRFMVGGASDAVAAEATVELTGDIAPYRQSQIVATAVTVSG